MEEDSAYSVKYFVKNEIPDKNEEQIRVYGAVIDHAPITNTNGYKPHEAVERLPVYLPEQALPLPVDDALSQDSDSVMLDGGECDFDQSQPCWKHPKIRENWKMVIAATALFTLGLVLLTVGIVLTVTSSFLHGLVFIVAGSFCFIPGVYHLVYAYLAVKGRRGYYFHHLPLFN